MSEKIKTNNIAETYLQFASKAGMTLMTLAAVVGMLELPDHANSRIVVPNQPIMVTENISNELNNPMRREREEIGTHYISYSEAQRTPSRSGKR